MAKGSTFKVGGKVHQGSFGEFDVWKRHTKSVVAGNDKGTTTDFVVTRKQKKHNVNHNVVNRVHVEVNHFMTMDEAMASVEKMNQTL